MTNVYLYPGLKNIFLKKYRNTYLSSISIQIAKNIIFICFQLFIINIFSCCDY